MRGKGRGLSWPPLLTAASVLLLLLVLVLLVLVLLLLLLLVLLLVLLLLLVVVLVLLVLVLVLVLLLLPPLLLLLLEGETATGGCSRAVVRTAFDETMKGLSKVSLPRSLKSPDELTDRPRSVDLSICRAFHERHGLT